MTEAEGMEEISALKRRGREPEESLAGLSPVLDELRESEALQRTLLDSLPAGVVIVDPETRMIERVNDHVADLFGAPPDRLVGRRCHLLLCPAEEKACPVCDLGQTVDMSERVMLRSDGSRLPVLKTVKKIRWKGREKLLECFVDISERKKAEEAVRAKQQELADIIEFFPDATLAIDREGRVILWNREIEKMTGVPAAEMMGQGNHAYTVPFYGEPRRQLMDLIFTEQEEVARLYPLIRRESGAIMTEVFCPALYGPGRQHHRGHRKHPRHHNPEAGGGGGRAQRGAPPAPGDDPPAAGRHNSGIPRLCPGAGHRDHRQPVWVHLFLPRGTAAVHPEHLVQGGDGGLHHQRAADDLSARKNGNLGGGGPAAAAADPQ
jgi:PAS domain S-box-containing protein